MLVDRKRYVDRIMLFSDTDLVKVVTGIRRCGKSSLLALVQQRLRDQGVREAQIASVNLESRKPQIRDDGELYQYFEDASTRSPGKLYIFIDEVQRIDGWHDVVNALRVDLDCDIYVTGSNAFLLSSSIATYLSGRYVEINVLPLVFSEYADFCGLELQAGSDMLGTKSGKTYTFDSIFERFMRYGGMPAIASLSTEQEQHFTYAKSLYDTIITRDVLDRERHASERLVSDPDLLRRVADFLADNIGNLSSVDGISNELTRLGRSVADKTVASYIKVLEDAYLFYECRRFDLRGKGLLKTNPKIYLSDVGMRRWLLGGKLSDTGRIFENLVFLQLLYEGYEVQVGKLYQKEIDFVAIRDDQRIYLQVADTLTGEATLNRELEPLRAIRDSYPKMIVARKDAISQNVEGIAIVPARDFFLPSNSTQ